MFTYAIPFGHQTAKLQKEKEVEKKQGNVGIAHNYVRTLVIFSVYVIKKSHTSK